MTNSETAAQHADTIEQISDPIEAYHARKHERMASVMVLTIPFIGEDTPECDLIWDMAYMPYAQGSYFWIEFGFILGCRLNNLPRLIRELARAAVAMRRLFLIFPIPWRDIGA